MDIRGPKGIPEVLEWLWLMLLLELTLELDGRMGTASGDKIERVPTLKRKRALTVDFGRL